jgi:hypothetical protein
MRDGERQNKAEGTSGGTRSREMDLFEDSENGAKAEGKEMQV